MIDVSVIYEYMLSCIPSSEAKIEAAHESNRLIDHTHFLVLHDMLAFGEAT